MNFGKKLSMLRKAMKLTQQNIANATNLHVRLIQKYELNLCIPKPENRSKIIHALNAPHSYFSEYNLETVSDIIDYINALDDEVGFSIKHNTQNGHSSIEFYNLQLNIYLEKLSEQRENLLNHVITQDEYSDWKKNYTNSELFSDDFVSKTLCALSKRNSLNNLKSNYSDYDIKGDFDKLNKYLTQKQNASPNADILEAFNKKE